MIKAMTGQMGYSGITLRRDRQRLKKNNNNANMLLFWLTVQTRAAGPSPELEGLWN